MQQSLSEPPPLLPLLPIVSAMPTSISMKALVPGSTWGLQNCGEPPPCLSMPPSNIRLLRKKTDCPQRGGNNTNGSVVSIGRNLTQVCWIRECISCPGDSSWRSWCSKRSPVFLFTIIIYCLFGHAHIVRKFPGQGSNLLHSNDNTESLTARPLGNSSSFLLIAVPSLKERREWRKEWQPHSRNKERNPDFKTLRLIALSKGNFRKLSTPPSKHGAVWSHPLPKPTCWLFRKILYWHDSLE